jgi:uncharacterized protein (TIGR03790 family)
MDLACLLTLALALTGAPLDPRTEGPQCAVVYNRRLPESQALAEYYATRRGVPSNQVFGFELPTTETMSREEFRNGLQQPLFKALEQGGLLTLQGAAPSRVTGGRVRYVTLCWGVPVRIPRDAGLVEPGQNKLPEPLQRNEAAVDSELAWLPLLPQNPALTGPIDNPLRGRTNAAQFHPTNGVLLVARLDGPSAEIARGLIDKAIAAETNGLWGRAYFDLRGLTNEALIQGEQWLRGAAEFVRRAGYETVVDERPATFGPGFPMSAIACYAGWYDSQVSGPFTRPVVEFMPGAIAYHLHSFSAAVVRSADQHWVGPLLAKGATATLGFVDEPYLQFTPNVAMLWAALVGYGFSYGEAAYASQPVLSWQTTVVGDPLYRPFGRLAPGEHVGFRFAALQQMLLMTTNQVWLPWATLQSVNFQLALGQSPAAVLNDLERDPGSPQSSVLLEKQGDLCEGLGKLSDAIAAYRRALRLSTSTQQRIRVTQALAQLLGLFTREAEALTLYQQFLKDFPDYPEPVEIYRKMLPLARTLNQPAEVARLQAEIDRSAPPPPVSK